MNLLKALLAFGLAALTLNTVRAETLTVAGVSLVIEPPFGYCALDVHSGDRAFFLKQRELLRPNNELIQASVPCDQLKAVVAGNLDSYSRWAQVQVINAGPELRTLPITRDAFVSSLTKTAQRKPLDLAAINSKVREKLKGEGIGVAASKMEVVGSDDNAVYVSMTGSIYSEGGSSAIAMFGSMTLVKQLPIGAYAYEKQGAPRGELPTAVAKKYLKSILDKN